MVAILSGRAQLRWERTGAAYLLAVSAAVSVAGSIPASVRAQGVDKVAVVAAGASDKAVAAVAATPQALGGDKSRTRFVIGLEREAQFQVFSLANPNRVIVELPDVRVQLPAHNGQSAIGLVKSFRGGLSAPGRMRVVIDVTEPVVVEKAVLEAKKDAGRPRLVLEIVPVDQKAPASKRPLHTASVGNLGASGVQPPLPRPAIKPEARAARAFKPTIVIDPGHGGHDSGAIQHGTVEKEVVLAFALALRAKLNATGRYKVLMTRETDTFIPLDERREFAERHKAALFIAVHADSTGRGSSSVRGATIYSLKEGVANELARSAKGTRSSDLLTAGELSAMKEVDNDASAVRGFLADLAQREQLSTRERTGTFVRSVIEFMGQSANLKDTPDRSANFAVLRTGQVPAVLIELAYVTNPSDAKLLKSEDWRNKVSGSIAVAVDNYFSHQVARLPGAM